MIYFWHNELKIYNPFLSACWKNKSDPVADYGFELWNVKGEGVALVKQLPGGLSIWLQSKDIKNMPALDSLVEVSLVGTGSTAIYAHRLPDEQDVVEFGERKFYASWGRDFGVLGPKIVTPSFFSEKAGYSVNDQMMIFRLNEGESWICAKFFNHSVRRLPTEQPQDA